LNFFFHNRPTLLSNVIHEREPEKVPFSYPLRVLAYVIVEFVQSFYHNRLPKWNQTKPNTFLPKSSSFCQNRPPFYAEKFPGKMSLSLRVLAYCAVSRKLPLKAFSSCVDDDTPESINLASTMGTVSN
jgi:hypothetical protein